MSPLPAGERTEEAALAARLARRDRAALQAVMAKYNQRLFRLARAVVESNEDAEDVLQEAYFRAFSSIDTFRGDASLFTWIASITLNEARGRRRKRRRWTNIIDPAGLPETLRPIFAPPVQPDPESEAGREEARRLMEKAIDGLPAIFRIVFMLRDVEGCSVEETAMQLNLAPATVKTRLHRARRLLREQLEAKLAAGMSDVFPFLGVRCAGIAQRVLARLAK
ncbi:MAG: RNA polymerase sigma factor [Rhodospirillaceae bacterium]|nr:RNA polymerase sigma factor [Rhodospirillaceae bacterium]